MNESLKVGDMVEIVRLNIVKPMPGGLTIGSRGTVVGSPDSFWAVQVDYGIGGLVWSARYSIRKLPPPQDWVKLCNLTDLPREVEHV